MTRIIRNEPSRSLVIARRFDIARQIVAWLAGLGFGAAVVTAFFAPYDGAIAILVAAVAAGLTYVALWGLALRFAREARIELLHKYGVAPNTDGIFVLLRAGEPHKDLAATRSVLGVYAPEPEPVPMSAGA
jgi:hypothetical protein